MFSLNLLFIFLWLMYLFLIKHLFTIGLITLYKTFLNLMKEVKMCLILEHLELTTLIRTTY